MNSHDRGRIRQARITPQRQKLITSLSKRNYKSAATHIAGHPKAKGYVFGTITQNIRKEIRHICSLRHKSILRDSNKAIKRFTWEAVWLELSNNVPTLVSFFKQLLPKPDKRFIAFLICAILKKRCKQMSLIQCTFSILLYSNATNKQVSVVTTKFPAVYVIYIGLQIPTTIHGLYESGSQY